MEARIQKLIAEAGICSRRKAEELIAQGSVTVNGKTAKLGENADIEKDKIVVNGERIRAQRKIYLMLNKPRGYITTVADPWGRKNVVDLIHLPWRVFPVGRLDRDATGLLLLTNDGEFANRIMHPRYEVKKTYEVMLDRRIEDAELRTIAKGVELDGKMIEAQVRRLGPRRVRISVHTGMNKEVKRIFKSVDHWVREINRTEVGPLKLNVKEGKYRTLTIGEVKAMMA